MLMDLPLLWYRYDLKVDGVLHVGAHLAEEADTYEHLCIAPVWWVEGNPGVYRYLHQKLLRYPEQRLIEALVYSEHTELDFNVTNYDGMSSSILEFGTHPQFSPDTVFVDKLRLPTSTIDFLADAHGITANFLNMDLQGAELHALQGAQRFLQGVDYIMTEVNSDEVYQHCARVDEIDAFLGIYGFKRTETHWVEGQGWGDAFYMKDSQ